MPLSSAFAPGGLISLSSRPYHAESIYRALRDDVGQAFAEGGVADASLFARAKSLGVVAYTKDRLENQANPLKATELLAPQERAYGCAPSPRATLNQRRAALAAATKSAAGDIGSNVSDALTMALGASFLALRETTVAEASIFPALPGVTGVFTRIGGVRRSYRIAYPLSVLGLQFVTYTDLHGATPTTQLHAGDVVGIVDANTDRIESVGVLQATSSGPAFQANITKPHDAGTMLVAYRWPYWCSTKRSALVVLTAAAAADAPSRRTVNRIMSRMVPGVSTWAIVAATGAHTAGPFTLDQSPLDSTPLGVVSF